MWHAIRQASSVLSRLAFGLKHVVSISGASAVVLALALACLVTLWLPSIADEPEIARQTEIESAARDADALPEQLDHRRDAPGNTAVVALAAEIRTHLGRIADGPSPTGTPRRQLTLLLALVALAAAGGLRRGLAHAAERARIDRAVPPGAHGESLATRLERLTGTAEYARAQQAHLVGERIELARALSESEIHERRLNAEIRQHREQIEKLEIAQMRDELTGALNFRYFLHRLNQALDEFVECSQGFCLVALDLDDFKGINDGYGHHVGDAALKEFAALLQRSVRDGDIVFRKSGDEFYVLMPGASAAQGERLGARLLELVNGHEVAYESADERYVVRLGTSIGILHCEQVDPHLVGALKRDQLISEVYGFADAALFKAKFSGKGCARIYTTGLTVHGVNPREYPPEFDALNRRLRARYALLPRDCQNEFNDHISACLRLLNPGSNERLPIPVVDCTNPVQ